MLDLQKEGALQLIYRSSERLFVSCYAFQSWLRVHGRSVMMR